MRTLTASELTRVSGGEDEIIVTGTRSSGFDLIGWMDMVRQAVDAQMAQWHAQLAQQVQLAPDDDDGQYGPWTLQPPPPADTADGVVTDRDGLTIDVNTDTPEQEESEDLVAQVYNILWEAEGGDPEVTWAAEWNEDTNRMHVYPIDLVG